MAGPTPSFWQQRFETGLVPWDRGQPSPQLAAWLGEGVLGAGEKVVVPGCGAGHEVAALAVAGCTVTALDYASAAVELTRQRLREAGQQAEVHRADVLQWQPALPCDAVYEQTCLCALHPDDWTRYAAQLHAWIRPAGRLCALFMQVRRESASQGVIEGPPYHCDINAMRALFPSSGWDWPGAPYPAVAHPQGWVELAVVLARRA
jgi:SAM-dependent methyltransferase